MMVAKVIWEPLNGRCRWRIYCLLISFRYGRLATTRSAFLTIYIIVKNFTIMKNYPNAPILHRFVLPAGTFDGSTVQSSAMLSVLI
jgi:hypothetical protein